jgi:ParB family chromosome partitioning protein
MIRNLQMIPLADLKVSKLNVRKHGAKDVASLAASIGAIGLVQPLLVRANGEGFEIVAGQRRYLAAKSLDADGQTGADPLPCVVLASNEDASAIEASLAENIERLPMDEMDQHEAFLALKKRGLDEADIAAHFGISEQIVRRRLALADLVPDIRRLYRRGDIDAKTLQVLTLATRERQKAWLRLVTDPQETAPPFWQLKAWLLGGAEISTKAALFDEAAYTGAIVSDLFGEERYFADPDEFWRLQNAAIAETRDKLTAAGWSQVEIIEPNRRFQTWDHEPVPKAKGGAAYIEVQGDGHVTVHEGLLPRGDARKALCYSNGDAGDEAEPEAMRAERPELSAPLANYVDLVRHSAVRLAVARTPKIALRLMLAHVIGGASLWKVEPERQPATSETVATALATLPSQAGFDAEREAARQLLGLDDGEGPLVAPDGGARTATVLAKLMQLSDKDVLSILAVVIAETLAMGTDLVDTLGATLAVDVAAHWRPDDTFFELVRDRETVGAMLAEVVGETAAATYLTDTGTKKKAIIRKALAGDGRTKVEGWLPRYVRFPQRQYTERALLARQRAAA